MKKKLFLIISMLLALSLVSGCGESEDTELEELINKLPSVEDPFNSKAPSQDTDNTSYISVSGKIDSVSKDSITLSTDGGSRKFYIDDSTNIFGGEVSEGEYITVTYDEKNKDEKKIYAFAITVLNGEPSVTEPQETTAAEPVSEEAPITVSETTESEKAVSETAADTEITTADTPQETEAATVSEEITTAAETVLQSSADEQTTPASAAETEPTETENTTS